MPTAPRAHSQITVKQLNGKWSLVSSAGSRYNSFLDGRSLASQNGYVGCTLSLTCFGKNTRAIVQLRGTWQKGDKMLIGCWHKDTDTDVCCCSLGSGKPEHDKIICAPGFWVSCSSGTWHSAQLKSGPKNWSPPHKAEGVCWGIEMTASGQLTFACAAAGTDLEWNGLQWFGEIMPPTDATNLVPAILFQPHQRVDSSQAYVLIEEIRHTS